MPAADPLVPPTLEVRDLTVRFGGVTAVDRLGFTVERGRLTGLIGPNGAGKTSTIDALTGFVTHGGRVLLDGSDLTGLPPHERARRGLVRTWQAIELFDDLTVAENCRAAVPSTPLRDRVRRGGSRRDPRALVAEAALTSVGLESLADSRPSELSHGHRKLVGVARALAGGPRLVLLDEPAAGLDTRETRRLAGMLRDITAGGVDLLLIDHDMDLVLGACDEVHVLDFGRLVASGSPSEVRDDPVVIGAYLGERVPGHGGRTSA